MTPSCPIDRIAFSTVGVSERVGEQETGKAEVSKKKKVDKEQEEEEEEEQTLCEECRGGDREHLLLLCDGCDLATHTTCLTPPLSQVVLCLCCCLLLNKQRLAPHNMPLTAPLSGASGQLVLPCLSRCRYW